MEDLSAFSAKPRLRALLDHLLPASRVQERQLPEERGCSKCPELVDCVADFWGIAARKSGSR